MIAMSCRRCGSTQLCKNGRTRSGQQKFHCKACNYYGTLDTKDQERAHRRATVENLHHERLSQRAIARTLSMSRNTVATILKKVLTPIGETIRPLVERPILELDGRQDERHGYAPATERRRPHNAEART
jgi:transposase-like protein